MMIKWNYDRQEILADGIVHGLGVVAGVVGVTVLLVLAAPTVGACLLDGSSTPSA